MAEHEIQQTAVHRLRVMIPDPQPEPEHPEWEYPTYYEADWEPPVDGHVTRQYWRVTGSDSGENNYLVVYPYQIRGLLDLLTRMESEHRESEGS